MAINAERIFSKLSSIAEDIDNTIGLITFFVCIAFGVSVVISLRFLPNVEISPESYEQLLSLANNPSIKPSIEAAMSDGFISISEYGQILELSSPKTLLVLRLEEK